MILQSAIIPRVEFGVSLKAGGGGWNHRSVHVDGEVLVDEKRNCYGDGKG